MLILAVRLAWIAGFLVGTITHVIDLAIAGFDVYAGYPDAVRLYWLSLTVLDPLAVLLTALRTRTGVVFGVVVIVSDVAINLTVSALIGGLGVAGLVLQIAFGIVVCTTAPLLWRAARRRSIPD
ncbi:hypothetical protein [Pseudolysinimonas sp.]